MARTRKQKELILKKYIERLDNAQAVFVLETQAISANDANSLKMALYDLGSSFSIVKTRLFQMALEKKGLPLSDNLNKSKAVVFSSEKMVESAKIIKDYIDLHKDKMLICFGYMDQNILTGEQIASLASLPSREILLSQALATMKAPISAFVNVLAGNIRKILFVLNAIQEQKTNVA